MDNYPYDYPVLTVNLDENMYELVLYDLSESEKMKILKTFKKNLDKALEKLKIFEKNQSAFHNDDDDTQNFFSVEGVYDEWIDSSEMEGEGPKSYEIGADVPYLCHIWNMIGFNILKELKKL